MAFPTSPTNGQKASVNGVTYVYNATIGAWTVASMFNEGITANVIAANSVTAVNSVSAPDINATTFTGSLSGVVITEAQPNITSVGTLINLDVSGNSFVENRTDSLIFTTRREITANTVIGNVNALSIGPVIKIVPGVTVIVSPGGHWEIS